MSDSNRRQGTSKKVSVGRKARLEAELKANLRKRKDHARARAGVKPDAQGLTEPARDKNDA
jgi:hypothetical protein